MTNNLDELLFSTKNLSEALVPFLILHVLKEGSANGAQIKERVDALLEMFNYGSEDAIKLYNSRLYRIIPRYLASGLIKESEKKRHQYSLSKEGEKKYKYWKEGLSFFSTNLENLINEYES